MKPEDQNVEIVDGTHPAIGGEIVVDHNQSGNSESAPEPEIDTTDLKPFNEHIIEDIEKANSGNDNPQIESEIVKPDLNVNPQPAAVEPTQPSQLNQQIQPSAATEQPQPQAIQSQFGGYPATAPSTNRLEDGGQPHGGAYSTNPENFSQQFSQSQSLAPPPMGGQPATPSFIPQGPIMGSAEPLNAPIEAQRVGTNINGIDNNKLKFSKKKLLFLLLPLALLIIGSGTYVFAFYSPNTPENVWKTGFGRTGKQMNAFVDKIQKPEELKLADKTSINLSGEVEVDGYKAKLDIDSKYSPKQSDSNISFKAKPGTEDEQEINLGAQVLTDMPEGATYPNIYLKIFGFSQLGLDEFVPNLVNYEDKWVAIEQDVISRLEDQALPEDSRDPQDITYQEYMSVVSDVNSVLQEYVFTNDDNYAVLRLDEFIGTEQSEGIDVNHYKAGINKQNFINFCTAMVNKLAENQTVKDLSGLDDDQLAEEVKLILADCQKSADTIKDDESLDLWLDKKYKLFHKVRIYEKPKDKFDCCEPPQDSSSEFLENEQSGLSDIDTETDISTAYYELGQVYKGGEEFMFFVNAKNESKDSQGNLRLELNVNFKDFSLDGSVVADLSESLGSKTKVTLKMQTEPYDGEINSAKPENAVSVEQMLKDVFGYTLPPKAPEVSANDRERKSDINKIHNALESYYDANQSYPPFKSINDSEFRNASMPDVGEQLYVDPAGGTDRLADRVGVNVYSYVVVPASCDGKKLKCTYYELSATLDDGQLYTKKSNR